MDFEFDMVIVFLDGILVLGLDMDDFDWLIGWFEFYSKKFIDDEEDSFVVLMLCYGFLIFLDINLRKVFIFNE